MERIGEEIIVWAGIECGLDRPESNPGGDEIFRTLSDRPWCPPSLLDVEYRVISGGKFTVALP